MGHKNQGRSQELLPVVKSVVYSCRKLIGQTDEC
jgi:hypothetical protein